MFTVIIRPVLAWIGACLVTAALLMGVMIGHAVIVEGISTDEALDLARALPVTLALSGTMAAVLLALPSLVLVMLLRLLHMPRGWGDAIAGAGAGAAVVYLTGFSASTEVWVQGLTYALLLTVGLLAGLSYWTLAGRPDIPVKPSETRRCVTAPHGQISRI